MDSPQNAPNGSSALSAAKEEEAMSSGNTHQQSRPFKTAFMNAVHVHVEHFTWSWFLWPMATLGISLTIAALPYRFRGLTTIGIIIYLFGVVQCTAITLCVITRFVVRRKSLRRSLDKASETFFFSTVGCGLSSFCVSES